MKLVAMAVLAACSSEVTVTPIHPAPRTMAPRFAGTVELFADHFPTRQYVDVDKMIVGDGSTARRVGDLNRSLLERGASLGCDGVIVDRVDTTADHQATRVTATCIFYTDGFVPEMTNLPHH
jgi:hypothetical protein